MSRDWSFIVEADVYSGVVPRERTHGTLEGFCGLSSPKQALSEMTLGAVPLPPWLTATQHQLPTYSTLVEGGGHCGDCYSSSWLVRVSDSSWAGAVQVPCRSNTKK